MIILTLFAFLAGVVTILSPCILPLLPIVLSGSVAGGRNRPFGIVTGFVASFSFFTLALTAIVRATGVSADALRYVAITALVLFGISLLLPQTQLLLERLLSRLAGMAPRTDQKKGFIGGLVIGLSLGLIWAPCVGPILASVITLAATSQVNFASVIITLAYALGTGLPMLGIAYGGQRLLTTLPWLQKRSAQIQRGFGVIMILTAAAIALNLDRQFQTAVLQVFPQYGAGLTVFESNNIVKDQIQKLKGSTDRKAAGSVLRPDGPAAPDFVGGQKWINSSPLSLQKELKGKVVLVDFWTYSCINCIRTFPYLKKWYETYKDKDFVIVGVHSPEFEFEKNYDNVLKATKDFGLLYPIVQDNDFKIWNAYQNDAWPSHFLIDKQGKIRYHHLGEGEYMTTENAIRELLDEKPLSDVEMQTAETTTTEIDPRMARLLTPETYLGWARAQRYAHPTTPNQIFNFTDTPNPDQNEVSLSGRWQSDKEFIMNTESSSSIRLNFYAQKIHLVMALDDQKADPKKGVVVQVKLDGKPLPSEYFTSDMNQAGEIVVNEPRKYDIIDLKNNPSRHTIELIFTQPGVEAFAFSFG